MASKSGKITALDLFAGAGGLSEGFAEAGCEMIGHIEMDPNACETLRTRTVYHELRKKGKLKDYYSFLKGEISRDALVKKNHLETEFASIMNAEINSENRTELIKRVKKILGKKKLDLIIGGPPCQAYSHVGRSRSKNKMVGDKRNFLYKHYVEFLKQLEPKMFVFENVPGLFTAGKGKYWKMLQNAMRNAGYSIDYRLIDVSKYGVPQKRRRIILIGWKAKKISLKGFPAIQTVERDYKVRDFLDDLPKIKAGGGALISSYRKSSVILEATGIRDKKMDFVPDHVARPHNPRDLEIYKIAVNKKKNGESVRYDKLPSKLQSHQNRRSFLDRYKVVDGSSPAAQTIVAHISQDGHYYIHPDIEQNRSISVREAARLQSFPDNYKFEGSRTSQFHQIGNAVPPMLSRLLARELMKHLPKKA